MKVETRTKENDFATYMGFELVEETKEGTVIKLKLAPHQLNPHGIAHGGVAATILDTSIGMSVYQVTGRKCVTVNLNLSFLEPIMKDDVLFSNGRIIRAGKSMATAEGEIMVNDKIVAKAIGTFKLL